MVPTKDRVPIGVIAVSRVSASSVELLLLPIFARVKFSCDGVSQCRKEPAISRTGEEKRAHELGAVRCHARSITRWARAAQEVTNALTGVKMNSTDARKHCIIKEFRSKGTEKRSPTHQ